MRSHRRRTASVAAAVALVVAVGVGLAVLAPTADAEVVDSTYGDDTDVVPNPERGFYHRVEIVDLSDADVASAREQGITLLHSYVHLDDFRSAPISTDLLARLSSGLAKARAGGMKVILRPAYNLGPYPNSEPDADESWILSHLSQLKPVLAANADVISSFEAGLIGAWGEWHTSTHGYDTDAAAKTRILQAILAAYPADRQVALRYPADVRAQLPRLTSAEADRIGNHQDCFGASDPDDWGTWGRDGTAVDEDKRLIATVGQRHVVGGETCNGDSPRANCATARSELASMHFSNLNIDYHPDVIARYRSEGCFDDIRRGLGYRLRLVSARHPSELSPGGQLALRVVVRNDGWAAPVNPRPVFVVLDGPAGAYPIALDADPRLWAPGVDNVIESTLTVPPNIPAGPYRLALWLPDQYPTLRNNPAFSVRLANTGTWDGAAGFNVLATNVVVAAGAPTDPPTSSASPPTSPASPPTSPADPPTSPSDPPTSPASPRPILVVDDFGGNPAWPSTQRNDLGGWTGANGLRNGQGAGTVADGALVLTYDHTGWFGTDVGTDVSAYRYLVIRIRGTAGGEEEHFQLSVGGRTAVFNQFVDGAGAHPRITTSYQDIRIPLAANAINAARPEQVSLGFWHGAAVGTVHIEQIAFEA